MSYILLLFTSQNLKNSKTCFPKTKWEHLKASLYHVRTKCKTGESHGIPLRSNKGFINKTFNFSARAEGAAICTLFPQLLFYDRQIICNRAQRFHFAWTNIIHTTDEESAQKRRQVHRLFWRTHICFWFRCKKSKIAWLLKTERECSKSYT